MNGNWEEMSLQLCDDDGIVRRGEMHHGVDYECTGSAHWSGYHITCSNPVHTLSEKEYNDWLYDRLYMQWDGGE